jgi:hypothetical protein
LLVTRDSIILALVEQLGVSFETAREVYGAVQRAVSKLN